MEDMSASGKPDFGILLLLADQEFVRELRASMAAQGFDEQRYQLTTARGPRVFLFFTQTK